MQTGITYFMYVVVKCDHLTFGFSKIHCPCLRVDGSETDDGEAWSAQDSLGVEENDR